jgi:hypothetical protein
MWRRAFLASIVVPLVAAAAPAGAVAAQGDVTATRSYIQADYALVRNAAARLGSARAVFASILRRVRSECPLVAASSPQTPQSTELSNEIIGAMVTGAYHVYPQGIVAFVRVAERLRWSNRGLTSSVHAYASKLKTVVALSSPDLCGDVKAWIASGYHTLPASTISFDQRFVPAWVALGELPPGLAPYERPEERSLLNRTVQLEEQVANFEAAAVETYAEVMNAIGVSP